MPGSIKTDDGPVRLTAEVGHSGLVEYGGQVHSEYDPDLRGIRGLRIYDEMRRNDPTVALGLRVINWMIGQVNWSVQPGGTTPADQEAAEFLESCRHDMSHTWGKLIRDALTCLPFGFSFLEIVYKQRNGPAADPPSRYDDGRIAWRKFTLLGHDSWARWAFDEVGGVKGFVQQGQMLSDHFAPETMVPIEKSVLFRLDDEKNNPDGVSLLRPLYDPWYKKKNLEEIEAIGIERDLTGVLIIHLPVNATTADHSKAKTLLEQFKADDMAGFLAPQFGPGEHERWRFEIIGSPGSKGIDTDKVIQRYQVVIARGFLLQFLMLGLSGTGSFALGKDQRDMFEVALGAILTNLDETINRFVVPPLFRFNDFGKLTALPRIVPGRISKADVEKLTKALMNLATGGLLTADADLEKYIRQEFDLPELVETESPAAPEEDTGDEEGTAKEGSKQQREPKKGAEEDDDQIIELPKPDDDEGWQRWIDEGIKRIERSGKRKASELLSFVVKAYDYETKLQQHQATYQGKMRSLAQQLREGTISHDAWQYKSQIEIARYTSDGYLLGKAQALGIRPSKLTGKKITPSDRQAIAGAVKEQYNYFSEFSQQVKAQVSGGKELTTAVDARAGLYQGSVRSASSQAQLNEEGEKMLTWERFAGDSCETCIKYGGETKTATKWRELDVWPAHNVKCAGNCRCGWSVAKE